MDAHRRRAVAYIAGRLITGDEATSIYDYQEQRHNSFSGEVSTQNVNVYDYEEKCFVGGEPNALYHYGDSKHIQLTVDGANFSGFDYGSNKHFSGSVDDRAIALYDYESLSCFNYSI